MESNVKVFDKGQMLIRKHEMATTVYLIKSGEVVVYDLTDDNKRVVIATLGPGEIVGELATMQGRNHSLYVEAKEKTQTIIFSIDAFKDKIAKADPLVQAMIKVLVERITLADEQILKAKTEDVYFEGDK